MKIGILGCGYVGQAAALQWKKEGHEVTVTTRHFERICQLKECANHVHLLTPQTFASFIESQEALLISVAPDSPSEYASTYLETAKQVVAYKNRASSLKQILYTSSTSVYGNCEGEWVNEDTLTKQIDSNRKVLIETEQTLLKGSTPDLNVCIFRLGEIYGQGREIEMRLRRTCHQPFAGDGNSYTNIIHIQDIVAALNFALSNHLQGIYNLCSDFHILRKQFYDKLCQQENLSPIQWDPTRINLHGGNRRVCNQKIKDAGFIFTHPDFSYMKS